MKIAFLRIAAIAAALSLCFAASAEAAVYDFSTFSTEGQSYEGVTLGNMTLNSETGSLQYTDSYGGGIAGNIPGGGADDVYLTFATAINGISLRAGDGDGDSDAFGITAFEFGTNNLLGTWYSAVFGGASEPEWYTLDVLASNIGRIVFDPCNAGVCPGSSLGSGGVVITDIITDTVVSPVPEPETYAMLLVGLGLIGFMARRREKFNF
jgi:hypothetical protein